MTDRREIAGDDAATAAIFDDIRRTLRIPAVNLIWLRLAARPAELELAWTLLKPTYASGAVEWAARSLRESWNLPRLPQWTGAQLQAAGLTDADQHAIRAVLATYDRTNRMASVAFSHLTQVFTGAEPRSASVIRPPPPLAQVATLLAVPEIEQLPGHVAQTVQEINALGEARGGARIIATMYLHLAHWPAFLALGWTALAPLHRDGQLQALSSAAIARSRELARTIEIPAIPQTDPQSTRSVLALAAEFLHSPIGKMLPIAAMLLAAMPDPENL
jgi:Halocarboxylic acid dehydrogenase DehI